MRAIRNRWICPIFWRYKQLHLLSCLNFMFSMTDLGFLVFFSYHVPLWWSSQESSIIVTSYFLYLIHYPIKNIDTTDQMMNIIAWSNILKVYFTYECINWNFAFRKSFLAFQLSVFLTVLFLLLILFFFRRRLKYHFVLFQITNIKRL